MTEHPAPTPAVSPETPTPELCRCGAMGTRSFLHFGGTREWRCDACPMPHPVRPHTPGWGTTR